MSTPLGVINYPAQQILVASDFSDGAEAALAVAAHYARALRARIHVFHVSDAAGTDVMRPLADVTAVAGRDVPITFSGSTGDPAERILKYAAVHSIDLIVVGTHGRTGVSRILLGSVAERVIRGSRRPVLVVPTPRGEAGRIPSSVGVDDDEASRSAAERSCLMCATSTADLICEPCRTRVRAEALEPKQQPAAP